MPENLREQYRQAYRHERIKANREYDNQYYYLDDYPVNVYDLPDEVDLFSVGILHLDPIAVGNATKSIEMRRIKDWYSGGFLSRYEGSISYEQYILVRQAITPDNLDDIPF